MKLYGQTDVGMVRANNQDRFDFCEYDANCCYAVVCDGMGGHAGGNVASELAVEAVKQTLADAYATFGRDRDICRLLTLALTKANEIVFSKSISDNSLRGMGTTAVLAFYIDGKMYIAHVGDSRAYLFSDRKLIPVTKDHSIVQEMIDGGEITPEQAENHPYRHVITRAIGIMPGVEVDSGELQYKRGQMVLLCSDGLTNMLSDAEIEEALGREKPEKLCAELIRLANTKGGSDNITVVVMSGASETEVSVIE